MEGNLFEFPIVYGSHLLTFGRKLLKLWYYLRHIINSYCPKFIIFYHVKDGGSWGVGSGGSVNLVQ